LLKQIDPFTELCQREPSLNMGVAELDREELPITVGKEYVAGDAVRTVDPSDAGLLELQA
jgi:hypothetical protein